MLVVAIHHEEGDATAISEEEFNLRISSLLAAHAGRSKHE